jgi:hypothetical protein
MVFAKDTELFSHKRIFKDLNPDNIVMPSLQEVGSSMSASNPPAPSQFNTAANF